MVFVGTADGHVKKIFIKSKALGFEYADVKIHENLTISVDLQMDPNKSHLYVMTKDRIAKVKLFDCGNFSHCSKCSDTNDPYCEWCNLDNTCFSSKLNNLSIISMVSIILLAVIIFGMITIKKKRVKKVDRLPCDKRYEFPKNKLHFIEELGAGHYGTVYKGIAKGIDFNKDKDQYESETEVAIKLVKRNEVSLHFFRSHNNRRLIHLFRAFFFLSHRLWWHLMKSSRSCVIWANI